MTITRNTIISNTMWVGAANVASQLISFFIIPLFITNLGSDLYGIWVLGGLALGYIGMLDGGFTDGLQKHIADARQNDNNEELLKVLLSGFLILFLIGSVVCITLAISRNFLVHFFNIEEQFQTAASHILLVSALFALLQWPLKLPGIYLKATLNLRETSIIGTFNSLASSVTMLALVYLAVDIVTMKIVVSAIMILGSLPIFWVAYRKCPSLPLKWSTLQPTKVKSIWKFSSGIIFYRFLGMLNYKVDNLVIAKMIGMTGVAHYVIASKLFQAVNRLKSLLLGAMTPVLFNLKSANDKTRLNKLLNQSIRYRAFLTIPLASLGIIIAPSFLKLWMGEEYSRLAIWSQLFLAVLVLSPLGNIQGFITSSGIHKPRNIITGVRVALNLVLSIALVPRFGIGGPILGTLISGLLLGDFLTFPYFCRVMELDYVKPYLTLLGIMAFNLPFFLLGLLFKDLLPDSWITLIGFAGMYTTLTYFLTLIFFFTREERGDICGVLENLHLPPAFCEASRKVMQC